MIEMYKLQEKSLLFRFLIILGIALLNEFFMVACIYKWKTAGVLISPHNCTDNIVHFFLQNILISLPSALIIILLLFEFKESFTDEMYFKVNSRYQRTAVILLTVVLLVAMIYSLYSQENKTRTVLCLFYYIVFIAFVEEFLFRDVFTYLLKNENAIIRYGIPNLLFGLGHLFSYSGWKSISADYLKFFITSQLLGLILSGCIFQFIKEKTKTIWIPILIHGFLDYTTIFTYK